MIETDSSRQGGSGGGGKHVGKEWKASARSEGIRDDPQVTFES